MSRTKRSLVFSFHGASKCSVAQLLASSLACFAMLTPAIAQRGDQSENGVSGDNSRASVGGSLLAPGTMLPTVVAVDEQGERVFDRDPAGKLYGARLWVPYLTAFPS